MKIYREERFSNEEGNVVIRLTNIEDETEGQFIADISVMSHFGIMPAPTPIRDAKSLEQAFTNFNQAVEDMKANLDAAKQKEQQKVKIARAGEIPSANKLFVP